MKVRITHIDGKLPNLALMALSSFHRERGDEVFFTKDVERGLYEPEYDFVYGSCIFERTRPRAERLMRAFPGAIVGGTGMDYGELIMPGKTHASMTLNPTVEQITGQISGLDYSIYPDFTGSIGFTQRGCRLRCGFCVVPRKEGKNVSVGTVNEIWRGPGFKKNIHLLDNDFFGNPEWRERVAEIRDGGFRVCLNQGINVRLLNDEAAEALSTIEYRDDQFQCRRLYTAWDNLRDEEIFFRGIDRLERYGILAKNVMAFMLIGYDPEETWDRIWHRFNRMVERGIMPYPMLFDVTRTDLKSWQRWVNTGLYRAVKWDEYRRSTKSDESIASYVKTIDPRTVTSKQNAQESLVFA